MSNKTENRTINMYVNGKQVGNDINSIRNAYRNVAREVNKLDRNSDEYRKGVKKLRGLKGQLANHQRDIKGVETRWQKLKGMASGFGPAVIAAMAGRAVIQGIRQAIDTIKEYQDANAKLISVLGVTKEETKQLREQQLALGSSTAFTAGQVTDAQTELAKLGFTMREITNLTPAVLYLAAASGTDLANAASIAGSTLRQFGLSSSETNTVVDVMAKSFSSSALDIEKFQVAMASAGPVAASAGVSLERTTALLGVLSDRGLDASTAGTSLRNIFLDIAKAGLTWEEAMGQINSATDKNVAALDLFGKRGATTAVILAKNGVAAEDLEEKLRGAAGAAQEMAEKQLDTLTGDLTKAQSAWEGFVLSVENGEGLIATAARGIVQSFTSIISTINDDDFTYFERFTMLFSDLMPGGGASAGLNALKLGLAAVREETTKLASEENMAGLTGIRDNLIAQRDAAEEGSTQYRLLSAEIERIMGLQQQMAGGILDTNAAPGATQDPEVTQETNRAAAIKALRMQLKDDLLQIETDAVQAELAVRAGGVVDLSEYERNAAMEKIANREADLQSISAYANTSIGIMGGLGAMAGQSAEYQQELALFQNAINGGLAITQAASSVKAADPFTYLALLGTVIGVISSTIGQAKSMSENASLPSPPAFAMGTDNAPGGLSLVGEKGPELVNLPQGSSVIPAGPSRNLLFGANAQPDFGSVPDLSGRSGGAASAGMEKKLEKYMSKMDTWARTLQVKQVQTDLDDYNERYTANLKRVRSVKS